MKVIIRYWRGGAGVVTDQQVVLLRQRRMEGKTQQTSAAIAGMSVRSARKWQWTLDVGDRARALVADPD
jgi:hypothetical protein